MSAKKGLRLACLHVASFPLAAWRRMDPDLRDGPVAITANGDVRSPIVAVSDEARARGVRVGLSAAQERIRDAGLVLRAASANAEEAARAALFDLAAAFSPRIEEGKPGTLYLDCAGTSALFSGETELARALTQAARRVDLEVSVGIACTRLAARQAAQRGGCTVLSRGLEWNFLGPLPLEVLNPSPDLRARLRRWGIRRLGELAELPAAAVATRLGSEGARLARRARGEDEGVLHVRPAPLRFMETVDLEHPCENLQGFTFVLCGLLDRLLARLSMRGFVCGDLHLSLRLTNRAREERDIVVAAPANDGRNLLALLRLAMERRPPSMPVTVIRMSARPERLRTTQLDLFRPNGPAAEPLAVALSHLHTLCGTGRVGRPLSVDSHRSEAWAIGIFSLPRAERAASRASSGSEKRVRLPGPVIAMRAIRPPRRLDVFSDHGRPDFIRPVAETGCDGATTPEGRASRSRGTDYCCTGRVVTSAGPWRVQGEWWAKDPFTRDYYDVQLSDGLLYRLFYDVTRQAWFVESVYD